MTTAHQDFMNLRTALDASLIEREAEIDAILLGLVAQEHVLLVGPPGTAKSQLATNLTRAIAGTSAFSILLTKFTTPEELFGPVMLTALKQDRYERAIDGYAPCADILFLDEIWKASSAILNTLLTLLQERVFDNGGIRIQCPLKLAIAASNEWPSAEEGQELGAVFDRFLIRRIVRPVTPANRNALLYGALPDVQPVFDARPRRRTPEAGGGTVNPLSDASKSALQLPVSDDAKACFGQILDELTAAGVRPGDRRSRKAVKIAQARAWLDGAPEVQPLHLECLGDVLWGSPEQIDTAAEIVSKIANPVGAATQALLKEVIEIETEVAAATGDPAKEIAAIKKLEDLEKRTKQLALQGGGQKAKDVVAHVRRARVKLQAKQLGISEEKAAAVLGG